jgi:hypothetical protein
MQEFRTGGKEEVVRQDGSDAVTWNQSFVLDLSHGGTSSSQLECSIWRAAAAGTGSVDRALPTSAARDGRETSPGGDRRGVFLGGAVISISELADYKGRELEQEFELEGHRAVPRALGGSGRLLLALMLVEKGARQLDHASAEAAAARSGTPQLQVRSRLKLSEKKSRDCTNFYSATLHREVVY